MKPHLGLDGRRADTALADICWRCFLLIELLVFSLAFFFVGFYSIYFLICLRYSKLRANTQHFSFDEDQLPVVSFIIPVYNESRMIESRIRNLSEIEYPRGKLEVVFVDGGSKDGTIEAIEEFGHNANYTLKTVKQGSRKGFNSAVIEGFHQTSGDIILITGAETRYASNAVKLLVNHFADPAVGAANGTMRLSNVEAGASPKIEAAYRTFYDFIRHAESKIDTPFDIKGEIAAARRGVCQHLIEKKEMQTKGCVDACFSYQAKLEGFKTAYEPSAVYFEPAPESLRESFKQQVRRAATLIQNMFCFKSLMFRSEYGKFGMLIMPAHFLMLIVLPYIFLFSILGMIGLVILSPSDLVAVSVLASCLIGLTFSQGIRAFFKVQIALIVATLKMITGIETQKFERLMSAR
jgi:biofilm PGA synthesis N-glycosyltransferase PgaC